MSVPAKSIRILFCVRSLGNGGVPRVLYNLASGLVTEPSVEDVLVAYFGPPEDMVAPVEEAGVRTTRVDPTRPWQMWKVTSAFDPDIIHTHTIVSDVIGRLVGRLQGIPVVSTVHTIYDHRPRAIRWADLLTSPLTDTQVGVS